MAVLKWYIDGQLVTIQPITFQLQMNSLFKSRVNRSLILNQRCKLQLQMRNKSLVAVYLGALRNRAQVLAALVKLLAGTNGVTQETEGNWVKA